jgi:hypothetical protein
MIASVTTSSIADRQAAYGQFNWSTCYAISMDTVMSRGPPTRAGVM